MQQFRADLHIHSRYSRATSTKLTPRALAAWGMVKGLAVLGTGDFTHARWRQELAEALTFDEASGLYRVTDPRGLMDALPEYAAPRASTHAGEGPRPPLFMLQGEISSIYKRDGQVRKVHNLVYMPNLQAAERLCRRLEQIGNLASDGRPILGLDSRNLLEMVLETDPRAFLIPAHIWTPWFSLFGSKSGFDSIDACFGDLTPEIFALETGLSSDPDMNRLWSSLDRFKLVSNSDAHSGENLGREANLFAGEASYAGIYHALRDNTGPSRFLGTLEFFPEEGKYHLDGHRACNVMLEPRETRELGGICPVCGKPLTVGVLHRVMELADRPAPVHQPDQHFLSLIPLPELLGEIIGTGSKSKKVTALHAKAVARFGSELALLQDAPLDDITRFFTPLGEAVGRMRRGEVTRQGGYDGEYGVVTVFSEEEQREIRHGSLLPGGAPIVKPRSPRAAKNAAGEKTVPAAPGGETTGPKASPAASPETVTRKRPASDIKKNSENQAQLKARTAGTEPTLVLAGPGTGKTHTLVGRITHLLGQGVPPEAVLAVTFTRRAATELEERLALSLRAEAPQTETLQKGDPAPYPLLAPQASTRRALPRADTLHALALEQWEAHTGSVPTLLDEETARRVCAGANAHLPLAALRPAWERINLAREKQTPQTPEDAALLAAYTSHKTAHNLADYTDLLEHWLARLTGVPAPPPWTHVLVDEIQDLSPLQLRLIVALLPPTGQGFFGIGDPDQSIYGFRGAHGKVHDFLQGVWPGLRVVALEDNYRSPAVILRAASALLAGHSACGPLRPALQAPGRIHMFSAPTAESEAAWVAGQIRRLIGQGSHTLDDAAGRDAGPLLGAGELSPGDIAVLVRMRSLAPVLQQALARMGIEASVPENEGFWKDPRVVPLLEEAHRRLGLVSPAAGQETSPAAAGTENDKAALRLPACPEDVFAHGPKAIAAWAGEDYLNALFRSSAAFKGLCAAFARHGGWQSLLNWIHLQADRELVRAKSEQVQIMSIHAAKGLEFKAVFLPALEEGILPFAGPGAFSGSVVSREDSAHKMPRQDTGKDAPKATPEEAARGSSGDAPAHTPAGGSAHMTAGGVAHMPVDMPVDVDEERRLLYVGITRACQSLFLSHAEKRQIFGRQVLAAPSRFLATLPLEEMRRSALRSQLVRKETQLSLF